MKKKKEIIVRKPKNSHGFENMGFSWPIYKGIVTKGYKIPTPIQRKVIPIIMNGKDILAMSRTGSGKTAAFLLPLLQKLYNSKMDNGKKPRKMERTVKQHTSLTTAIKALIISPTRELALQTYKFTKEFSRFSGIHAILVLGGDSMDSQFATFHNSKEPPDIVIATPGRLLHLLVEMNLYLKGVNTLILDEADRLLEMGFAQQLTEIVDRLPGVEDRQTLLFSATVPSSLAEFSKSQGILNNDDSSYRFIRLDTEFKLSQNLTLNFLATRSEDKLHSLLYLLRGGIPTIGQTDEPESVDDHSLPKDPFPLNTNNFVKHKPKATSKTLVFLPTKHHVEYFREILEFIGIACTYAYSSLDPVARKTNVAKFACGDVGIMLVTDIAARGIDIPLLDNVIMYAFPATPKLFLHRVGRVARAGKSGKAYAIVAPNEVPYVLDLMNFLGHDLSYYRVDDADQPDAPEEGAALVRDYESEVLNRRPRHYLGAFPRETLDEERAILSTEDFTYMGQVCERAYEKYLRSLAPPSHDSIRRAKLDFLAPGGPSVLKTHPVFQAVAGEGREPDPTGTLPNADDNLRFLSRLKAYKPDNAIFEDRKKVRARAQINSVAPGDAPSTDDPGDVPKGTKDHTSTKKKDMKKALLLSQKRIDKNFRALRNSAKSTTGIPTFADPKYFVSYLPKNFESEKGMELTQDIVLDLENDEGDGKANKGSKPHKIRDGLAWDPKRKKFFNPSGSNKTKTIRTESGTRIPASYKTDIYQTWLKKTHGGATATPQTEPGAGPGWRNKRRNINGHIPAPFPKNQSTGWDNDGGIPATGASKTSKTLRGGKAYGSQVKGGKKNNFGKALGLKRPEQIFKERSRKERIDAYSSYRRKVNSSKRKKKKKGKN